MNSMFILTEKLSLQANVGIDPIFVSIGGYDLHWYTVIILVAVCVGIALVQKEAKRFIGSQLDFIFNMCFWSIIFGIIGARLYYVIFKWSYFSNNLSEIYKMWNGGLAIHGGIIAALLTAYIYCKKYKKRFVRYVDFIAPAFLFSQAIGRWGNFFNQEAHGTKTSVETIQNFFTPNFIVEGMKIDGVYYLPAFYYEFLACLALFIFLIIIRRAKYIKVGTITGIYLIGHGIIRFLIEIIRTDALKIGAFKAAHIVCITMIFIGFVMLMINMRKNKFEDLYNDESNIDKSLF